MRRANSYTPSWGHNRLFSRIPSASSGHLPQCCGTQGRRSESHQSFGPVMDRTVTRVELNVICLPQEPCCLSPPWHWAAVRKGAQLITLHVASGSVRNALSYRTHLNIHVAMDSPYCLVSRQRSPGRGLPRPLGGRVHRATDSPARWAAWQGPPGRGLPRPLSVVAGSTRPRTPSLARRCGRVHPFEERCSIHPPTAH